MLKRSRSGGKESGRGGLVSRVDHCVWLDYTTSEHTGRELFGSRRLCFAVGRGWKECEQAACGLEENKQANREMKDAEWNVMNQEGFDEPNSWASMRCEDAHSCRVEVVSGVCRKRLGGGELPCPQGFKIPRFLEARLTLDDLGCDAGGTYPEEFLVNDKE